MTAEKLRENLFFYGIFLLLGVLTLILLRPFTTALLTALALIVILKPLYNWLLPKRLINHSSRRATAITIIIFILILAIPVLWFGSRVLTQAGSFFQDLFTLNLSAPAESEDIVTRMQTLIASINLSDVTIQQVVDGFYSISEALVNGITEALLALAQALPRFFVNTIIILVVLMVALPRFKAPEKNRIAQSIPLPPEITQLYLEKISLMIMAMFKGTFVIAIVQGSAMGLVFWLAGVPYVAVLTILCIFLALLPMIGISLVAWPVGILLILQGNVWQGVFVIGMFLIVIAQIDTVLRPMLVPKGAYLNPALVLLSVFGGILLMGMIGVIYGPVIMVLLVTTIEIYTRYYAQPEAIREGGKIDLHTLGLIPDEEVPDEENVLRRAGGSMRRGASRMLHWAMTEEDGGGEGNVAMVDDARDGADDGGNDGSSPGNVAPADQTGATPYESQAN